MRTRSTTLFLFAAVLYTSSLIAQDANYWNSSYGPGGFLTPGAVIAYNRDSGVFSYNPALLAFTNKSSASISGNIYQLEGVTYDDALGKGLPLQYGGGSIIPLMVAHIIAIHGRKPFVLGYALIRNPVSSFSATQRKDGRMNVLDDSYSPGKEYFIGQFTQQSLITETEGMLSGGFKLSSRWSVGFSAEGHIRSQNFLTDLSSKALYNVSVDTNGLPPIALTSNNYQQTYTHLGVRFKGGISYNAGPHHLGLLITSPLLHIWGSSTLTSDLVVNNIRQDGIAINLLANTRQTDLKTRWKIPASIGLGYAYDYCPSGQIYFASEYFMKVNDYRVVSPRNDYFLRPDTGNNNASTASLLQLRDARHAVLNFAAGISFPVKPDVVGYIAFRTDFTYGDENLFSGNPDSGSGYSASNTQWNNYHLQLGANFRKRKFNLRPGLMLSYGETGRYTMPINFDDAKDTNLLTGTAHDVKAGRFALGFLLSYIHNL